jgi:hypothetical protein
MIAKTDDFFLQSNASKQAPIPDRASNLYTTSREGQLIFSIKLLVSIYLYQDSSHTVMGRWVDGMFQL